MKNLLLCLIFLFPIFSQSSATGHKAPECLAGVFPDKFAVSFEIINPPEKNRSLKKRNIQIGDLDYSWVAEPGNFDKKIFIPSKYAFGVGRINNGGNSENPVKIQEIVKKIHARGSVYLNEKEEEKRANEDLKLRDMVVNVMANDAEVVMYSRSREAMKILFSQKPTHMRMTMKTPYQDQSYSCMTKINYE